MKTATGTSRDSFVSVSIRAVAVTALCCVLFACGGGGGSSAGTAVSETVGSEVTATFVDAPVAGVAYQSGSLRGLTDANGNFRYLAGAPVIFKVGDIVLGQSTGAGVLTPINFSTDGSNADTPSVVATVQFLLSVADMDPNGNLSIPVTVSTAAVGKSINFASADAERQVAAMVAMVAPGKTCVSSEAARSHMKNSLNKLAAGTYSGTWVAPASVPSSGTFKVTIDNTGAMHGIAMLGKTVVDVTSSMSSTLVSGSTYAITGTVSNGATWFGTIDLHTKTLKGSALYDGVAATFSARK